MVETLKRLWAIPAIHAVGTGIIALVISGASYLLTSVDTVSAILTVLHVPPVIVPIAAGTVTTAVAKVLPSPTQNPAQ